MASLKLAMVVDSDNAVVGDIYITGGTVRLTSSLSEEVAQELFTRFKFFQGEWFLDTTLGVPYFQTILGIKTPIGIVTQIFRKVVSTCPGVASVKSFSLKQLASRAVSVSFVCILSDGTTLTQADFVPFVVGA